MQTLNEIIADLKDIAISNNYEGATVDGLIYLMASGIYKNQLNVVNTAREVSPSSCTLVNSAIQHAQDKNYSVYRGRNQHILIKYATPIETKQVKKFDVCKISLFIKYLPSLRMFWLFFHINKKDLKN